MSSPQPRHGKKPSAGAARRADFDELHDAVCFDDEPDHRYGDGMTNAIKTEYICMVLGYPQNGFDLDLPFPVEDWLGSSDQSLINCGLYLNDLRSQFYGAIMTLTGDRAIVFKKHAHAEFWRFTFNSESHARLRGDILLDDRTLN